LSFNEDKQLKRPHGTSSWGVAETQEEINSAAVLGFAANAFSFRSHGLPKA
jgi:hypothetical protein